MPTLQETTGVRALSTESQEDTAARRPWREVVSNVARVAGRFLTMPEPPDYRSDHYRPTLAAEKVEPTAEQQACVPVVEVAVATVAPTEELLN